jgi:hypothetical protein
VSLFFLLLIFDVIGATMAFLISYDELARHYSDRRAPLREAARRATTALIFLVVLSAVVTFIVARATP